MSRFRPMAACLAAAVFSPALAVDASAAMAAPLTGYSNPGGSGGRSTAILVTVNFPWASDYSHSSVLVDGSYDNYIQFSSFAVSGKWIQFDFSSPVVIDEARLYQSASSSHGDWKWQGSANAADWSDVGGSFTLGGAAMQTQTALQGNSSAYRYYRLLGVAGSTDSSAFLQEFEFRIWVDPAAANSYLFAGGAGNRSAYIASSQSSDRSPLGGAGALVDGWLGPVAYFDFTSAGGNFQFGFPAPRIITEARWFPNGVNGIGWWTWYASQNGSDWTNLGTAAWPGKVNSTLYTIDGHYQYDWPTGYVYVDTALAGNTTAYSYYRLQHSNGSVGDNYVLEATFRISAEPPAPAPAVLGVISAGAFGGFSAFAPGSWIEIYGTNLGPVGGRTWTGSDFDGMTAPTMLAGTSVKVGGQAAFIDYVSPGQVNVQVPSEVGAGAQSVIVTTAAGASLPFTATVNATQAGLLAPPNFNVNGTHYVVALFPDGTYVLPSGAIAGVTSRRAKPGDTIILYGIGFGAVDPSIPAGRLVGDMNTLAAPFDVSFGGTKARLDYDGLAPNYLGLYQFNVIVPEVAAGDTVPLTFSLGGVSGGQTLSTAVEN